MIRKSFIISTSIVLGIILSGCGSGDSGDSDKNSDGIPTFIGDTYNQEIKNFINDFRSSEQLCGSSVQPEIGPVGHLSSTQYIAGDMAKKIDAGKFSVDTDYNRREATREMQRILNNDFFGASSVALFTNSDFNITGITKEDLLNSPDICRTVMNPLFTYIGYGKKNNVEVVVLTADDINK